MSYLNTKSSNGRNTYHTSVSKFLNGGNFGTLFNGKNKIVNGMEDPSHLGFIFGIDLDTSGLFAIPNSSTVNTIPNVINDRTCSVLDYLNNSISPNTTEMVIKNISNNQNGKTFVNLSDLYKKDELTNNFILDKNSPSIQKTFKYEYIEMKKFIDGFKTITTLHPYMLQTVEGLQDVYKQYYNLHKDPYLGGKELKIKIKCLESMDLRMSALFDSYFKSVYNHKYRRMNIPKNLLKFNCWILIHDLRNVKLNDNININSVNDKNLTTEIISNLSTILFKFKNCIFDIEDIGNMLNTISNIETNQTTFEFSFNYTDIDLYVNSLADYLEQDDNYNDLYRSYYELLDINELNDIRFNSLDFSKALTDIKNFSNKIINKNNYKFDSPIGNAYDSKLGNLLTASMISSISNLDVNSVRNNLSIF